MQIQTLWPRNLKQDLTQMLRHLAALANHHTGNWFRKPACRWSCLPTTLPAPLHATAALPDRRMMRPAEELGVKP